MAAPALLKVLRRRRARPGNPVRLDPPVSGPSCPHSQVVGANPPDGLCWAHGSSQEPVKATFFSRSILLLSAIFCGSWREVVWLLPFGWW